MQGNPSVGSKGNHAHFVLLSCYLIVRQRITKGRSTLHLTVDFQPLRIAQSWLVEELHKVLLIKLYNQIKLIADNCLG